jgi:hypothetical protein
METIIFSAPTGTVNNYNENGDPIFESLKPEEKRRLELNSFIWKGMLDFIISIKKHFGKEVEFITFNKNSISKVFLNFCLNPTKKDAEMLEEVVFENKSNAGGYKSLIEDGVWKMGRISIKNPLLYKFLKPFLKILLKYKLFKN